MFGYVITQQEELKLREFNVYNGYYCGLCKTVGAEYGQLLRLGLQFEMAFLALFLESLDDAPEEISEEHCVAHHIKKKPVIRCSAQEYAAAMTVILGYENNLDDIQDDGTSAKTLSRSLVLHSAFSKAKDKFPEAASRIHEQLELLYQLEREHCRSIDDPTNAFGEVMRTIFLSYFQDQHHAADRTPANPANPANPADSVSPAGADSAESDSAPDPASGSDESISVRDSATNSAKLNAAEIQYTKPDAAIRVVSEFAYQLGRWIYLIDALDDLAEDRKTGSYNPLLSVPEDRVLRLAHDLLYHALGEMARALDLLEVKKNRGIIENIVYLGLRTKTDQILAKGQDPELEIKNEESVNGKQ